MSLLVQHAGPRCVLNKTRGHRELAVWRRRGPTETSLHWQTRWTEGNRARSVSLDSNRWHVTPDRIHDDCPVQFQTFVGWFLSLNCELAVFLHQFCLAWLSVLFFFVTETWPANSWEIHRSWGETKSVWGAWQTDPAIHEDHRSLQGEGNLAHGTHLLTCQIVCSARFCYWNIRAAALIDFICIAGTS